MTEVTTTSPSLAPQWSGQLRAAIISDNQTLPAKQQRTKLLHLLEDPRAKFVVTGQQLGLFGGPLLTLYKALHAVKLAQELSRESDVPVLPIFWLQGEDHDIEEIASVTCPIESSPGAAGDQHEFLRTLSLNTETWSDDDKRRSVGWLPLPEEISALTEELRRALPEGDGTDWVMTLVTQAYQPGTSFRMAFKSLLDGLLGDEAVIFFDPLLPEARAAAAPVYLSALSHTLEVSSALLQSAEHSQVYVRDRSPLFFYHPHGASGARYRLVEDSSGIFRAVGADFERTSSQLQSAIALADGSISASALLRPIVQDAILPTICYVGGQAEVRYFEQVGIVASVLGVPQPKIVPRVSLLLVDAKTNRLRTQLGLSLPECLADDAGLAQIIGKRELGDTPESLFAKLREKLEAALFEPLESFKRVDPEAEQQVRRAQDKITRAVDGLQERIARSTRAAQGRDAARLGRLRSVLRPTGLPQERVVPSIWYAAKLGSTFATLLLGQIDPNAISLVEQVVNLSEIGGTAGNGT